MADLIEASTEAAARSAARSMEGVFSKAIHELVDKVIHLRMLVEATLDFPRKNSTSSKPPTRAASSP